MFKVTIENLESKKQCVFEFSYTDVVEEPKDEIKKILQDQFLQHLEKVK